MRHSQSPAAFFKGTCVTASPLLVTVLPLHYVKRPTLSRQACVCVELLMFGLLLRISRGVPFGIVAIWIYRSWKERGRIFWCSAKRARSVKGGSREGGHSYLFTERKIMVTGPGLREARCVYSCRLSPLSLVTRVPVGRLNSRDLPTASPSPPSFYQTRGHAVRSGCCMG